MRADVVIVGAGLTGLSVAYNLAKQGLKKILILEKNYPGSGITGRAIGGVTQQLSSREEIELAREGVRILRKLSDELKFNIFFRQSGYIKLATKKEEVGELKQKIRLQRSLGVKSTFLTREKILELVPVLNSDEILGGSFCSDDGIVYPFGLLWAYLKAVKNLGVRLLIAEVRGIKVNGGVKSVLTNEGEIKTPVLVNAAGADSANVAKLAGLNMPNILYKGEYAVTEPLKAFLNPMLEIPAFNMFVNQTARGEIVGGITSPATEKNGQCSLEFFSTFGKGIIKIIPKMRDINIMRSWTGFFDISPDRKPIIGQDRIDGFIQACCLGQNFFVLAPVVGKLVAKLICGISTKLKMYSPERFNEES